MENSYLFNGKFHAGIYGPIDISINNKFNNNLLKKNITLPLPYFLINYIDELMLQMFQLSDFRLVDIAQEDTEWINKVNQENTLMENKNIIKDSTIKEIKVKNNIIQFYIY